MRKQARADSLGNVHMGLPPSLVFHTNGTKAPDAQNICYCHWHIHSTSGKSSRDWSSRSEAESRKLDTISTCSNKGGWGALEQGTDAHLCHSPSHWSSSDRRVPTVNYSWCHRRVNVCASRSECECEWVVHCALCDITVEKRCGLLPLSYTPRSTSTTSFSSFFKSIWGYRSTADISRTKKKPYL